MSPLRVMVISLMVLVMMIVMHWDVLLWPLLMLLFFSSLKVCKCCQDRSVLLPKEERERSRESA